MEKKLLTALFGEKGERLCLSIFSLFERFPNLFPQSLLEELKGFLSNRTPDSLEKYSVKTLTKILFTLCKVQRDVQKEKQIAMHLIEITSSVYGIAIALSTLKENEVFGETQIFNAIQELIPGIKVVTNSFHAMPPGNVHLFYIEIKKLRGGNFSDEEKKILNENLNTLLLQNIENQSPSIFFAGNEEELIKNIRHLNDEVKEPEDLPQVMISFVGYQQKMIKFLVIVLRVMTPIAPPISFLSKQFPPSIPFSLEGTFCTGRVEDRYPKEASFFTVELNSALFSKKSDTIDLRAARQYVGRFIKNALGPFRDYNGGLIQKENEQYNAIRDALEKQNAHFPHLDDLFYAIKPLSMRILITPETGLTLVSLYKKLSRKPVSEQQSYLLETFSSKDTLCLMIKTKDSDLESALIEHLHGKVQNLGYGTLKQEGYFYLFLFNQYPQNTLLLELVHPFLQGQDKECCCRKKSLLQLNLQGGNPPSLNPRIANDINCHILSNFLFERLTRINSKGEIEPAAAETIEVSPCQKKYIFKLRPSGWSCGEEVTAHDFVRAWKRAILSSSPSSVCYNFFSPIRNVEKARKKEIPIEKVGILAFDSKTLHVKLEAPCSYFLNLVSTPYFSPLFGNAEEPKTFNGPFTLASWDSDKSISLTANPFYWNAKHNRLGGVFFRMVRDPKVAYEMFETGKLDILGDPTSPLPPEILSLPETQKKLMFNETSRIFWIHCNLHAFPLNNAHLRRALSLALNRKALVDNVFIHQTPSLSPFPPKYASFQDDLEGNIPQAKLYFKKALEELQIDPKEFPPLVFTHSDLSFEKPLFLELRKQWKETLGVEIVSQEVSWSEFSSALEKNEFQLGGLFRRDLFNHPIFYLNFFKNEPHNPHRWDNPQYAALLSEFENGENKDVCLQEIEKLLIEKAPVIPLANQRYLILANAWIQEGSWNENQFLNLKEIGIDENLNIRHLNTDSHHS